MLFKRPNKLWSRPLIHTATLPVYGWAISCIVIFVNAWNELGMKQVDNPFRAYLNSSCSSSDYRLPIPVFSPFSSRTCHSLSSGPACHLDNPKKQLELINGGHDYLIG